MDLTLSLANPVPYQSSPVLKCRAALLSVNVDFNFGIVIMGPNTGVTNFPKSTSRNYERQPVIRAFSLTVNLMDLEPGRGDGNYSCVVTISANELTDVIRDGDSSIDDLFITVQGLCIKGLATVQSEAVPHASSLDINFIS